jgi:histidine decarboxylase
MAINKNLQNSVGPYDTYSDGYGNPNSGSGGYVLGAIMSVGVVDAKLGHDGSHLLDKINAFDIAECNDAYIGQINMITVSSFCGPHGLLLGYDFLKPAKEHQKGAYGVSEVSLDDITVPVYSIEPILEATRAMFGTVDNRQYPFRPGTHVPCASKNIASEGPVHVYTAFSLGIAKDREKNACTLMEDVGTIPLDIGEDGIAKYKSKIVKCIALASLEIGKNQRVEYEKILVGIVDGVAKEGQFACALVCCPYLSLAKDAVSKVGAENLSKITLEDWKAKVS